ncbi:MAG: hypothetical protein V1899_00085 [Planctomycetota bacterium]
MLTLREQFTATGNRILDERARRYATLDTPEKIYALQRELRTVARDIFGEYTLTLAVSDTPPKVMKAGSLNADGIIIEKFLFESLPNFWVPTLLYRPARDIGKCPALVMPVGHWWGGKCHPIYQRLMRLLARHGIICASFDGCGHGERIPWFHPVVRDCASHLAAIHPPGEDKPYPLGEAACHGFWPANTVTSAHCLIGDPGYLCGVHQHALTATAGKRLVDLLISRQDVDPVRIGACGASGGGTDTRFLAALDERIRLAVPASIMSSDRALTGGDADQSFFFTLNRGVSQNDLLICLAPNPLLIISASEDRHDSAKIAAFYRPFWAAFGKDDAIESGTGQGPHGFPHESRKIIAEFVLKHFRGDTQPIADAEHADTLPLRSERELQTTLIGNVCLDGIGKGPLDMVRERALHLAKTRSPLAGDQLRVAVIKTLGETEETLNAPPQNVNADMTQIAWNGESGVPLRIMREGHGRAFILCAHENGSEGAALSEARLALQRTDATIGLLDTRDIGIGNTPEPEYNGAFLAPMLMGNQARLARLALHQGRTLIGLRVTDLLQAARVLAATTTTVSQAPRLPRAHELSHLSEQAGETPAVQENSRCSAAVQNGAFDSLDLVAEGGLGLAALLCVYLQPEAYRRVILYRTPISWTELASGAGRFYNFAHFLYGVLERFDTADLSRALPPDKLIWINPTDASGKVMPLNVARKIHRGAHVVFKHARVERELARALKSGQSPICRHRNFNHASTRMEPLMSLLQNLKIQKIK